MDRGEIAAAQRFSQILSPDAPAAFEKSRLVCVWVSVVSGLLGVGGAAIIIPLLLYVPPRFGFEQLDIRTATGIAITHVFFSTSSGAVAHALRAAADRYSADLVVDLAGGISLDFSNMGSASGLRI